MRIIDTDERYEDNIVIEAFEKYKECRVYSKTKEIDETNNRIVYSIAIELIKGDNESTFIYTSDKDEILILQRAIDETGIAVTDYTHVVQGEIDRNESTVEAIDF